MASLSEADLFHVFGVVHVPQPAQHRHAAAPEVGERIRQRMGARPSRPREWTRGPASAERNQPETTVAGRSECRVGSPEGSKRRDNVVPTGVGNVAAQQNRLAPPEP